MEDNETECHLNLTTLCRNVLPNHHRLMLVLLFTETQGQKILPLCKKSFAQASVWLMPIPTKKKCSTPKKQQVFYDCVFFLARDATCTKCLLWSPWAILVSKATHYLTLRGFYISRLNF